MLTVLDIRALDHFVENKLLPLVHGFAEREQHVSQHRHPYAHQFLLDHCIARSQYHFELDIRTLLVFLGLRIPVLKDLFLLL